MEELLKEKLTYSNCPHKEREALTPIYSKFVPIKDRPL